MDLEDKGLSSACLKRLIRYVIGNICRIRRGLCIGHLMLWKDNNDLFLFSFTANLDFQVHTVVAKTKRQG